MIAKASVILLGVVSLAGAADTTPSKGTQIGQTINDAITAALPVTKLIGDAVKALLPSGDKVKKSDVDAAVQKAADQARAQAVSESNAQLARLSGVLKEIQITNELGDNARLAVSDLVVIRSRLTEPISDAGWDQLKDEWNKIAKKSLSAVVGFDQKELDQISDPEVQKELATLKHNSDRDTTDFERLIDAKNQNQALTLLLQISARLDDLASAPSVQLKSFGAQLATLAQGTPKNPPPPPPPQQPPPPPPKSPLTTLLQKTNAR
ncbi:MAG TPA: hypothetical protein VMJ34_04175 [Bryobacteraceae bacterium]|nr:hypothetical protein [Bryobacteraceae bacterium]